MRDGEHLHLTLTPALDEKAEHRQSRAGRRNRKSKSPSVLSDMDGARKSGLQQGDILVSVNGQPLRSDRAPERD